MGLTRLFYCLASGSLPSILSIPSMSFHGQRLRWYFLKRTSRSASQCSGLTSLMGSHSAGLLLVPLRAVVNFHSLE